MADLERLEALRFGTGIPQATFLRGLLQAALSLGEAVRTDDDEALSAALEAIREMVR